MSSPQMPLISICVSAFNHAKYIEATVASVFQQTYPNLQVIITDDGSTDGTLELLQALSGSYDFQLIEQTNQGLTASLNNMLFNYVKGEYVLVGLGSDDQMTSGMIEALYGYLQKTPDAEICIGGCEVIDGNGQVVGIRYESKQHPPLSFEDIFLKHKLPASQCALIKTDILKEVGGYREDIRLEDYYMWLKLSHAGHQIHSLYQPLVRYREHQTNKHKDTAFMTDAKLAIISEYKDHPKFGEVYQRTGYSAISRLSKRYPLEAKALLAKLDFWWNPIKFTKAWFRLLFTKKATG